MATLAPGCRVTADVAALAAVAEADDVVELELCRVRMPLRRAHRAGHGEVSVRDLVLVRIVTADGSVGWGECSALTHPTYSAEYTSGAFAVLRDEVAPWILGESHGPVVGHPMAASAVVGAHLDARLRSSGTALVERLGALHGRPSPSVPTTAVVGRHADTDELLAVVDGHVTSGATLVKLKVTPHPADLDNVSAVRAAWPGLALAVDGNGTLDHRSIAILDGFGLVYVEQPAPADDLLGSAAMAERLSCPVALDESATSMAALEVALTVGAGTLVNVKPSRLGGPLAAVDVARRVGDAGCAAFVGGMLESGIGRASALAVAALPIFGLPADLGPSDRYFEQDVTPPIGLDGRGAVVVPPGPGIGVVPDPEVLAEVTVERSVHTR
jgi:O-succinylbenzoate synthase